MRRPGPPHGDGRGNAEGKAGEGEGACACPNARDGAFRLRGVSRTMATTQRPNRRTGWTILIVPPNPLRKTRTVHIGRRHVRAALAIAGLCCLTIAGLGVVVFSDSLQVTATADELADAHQMILTLTDSLQSMGDLDVPDGEGEGTAHNAKNVGSRV